MYASDVIKAQNCTEAFGTLHLKGIIILSSSLDNPPKVGTVITPILETKN